MEDIRDQDLIDFILRSVEKAKVVNGYYASLPNEEGTLCSYYHHTSDVRYKLREEKDWRKFCRKMRKVAFALNDFVAIDELRVSDGKTVYTYLAQMNWKIDVGMGECLVVIKSEKSPAEFMAMFERAQLQKMGAVEQVKGKAKSI